MAAQITFRDKKMKLFLSKLQKAAKGVDKSDKKYGRLLSAIVFKDVIKHFEDEKGPSGRWEQWSDVYSDQMDKNGWGGNLILSDKGNLRQHNLPGNFRSVSRGFEFFNNAKTKTGFPYAFAHDNDGSRDSLPQRKFMWVSTKAMNDMTKQTLDFVIRQKK